MPTLVRVFVFVRLQMQVPLLDQVNELTGGTEECHPTKNNPVPVSVVSVDGFHVPRNITRQAVCT